MITPTKRTTALLEARGWYPDVVERYIQPIHRRKDFLGFGDIIACSPQEGIICVQATTNAHAMNRVDKIISKGWLPRMWLMSGGTLEVWGWRKLFGKNKDGSKSKRAQWKVRRIEIILDPDNNTGLLYREVECDEAT